MNLHVDAASGDSESEIEISQSSSEGRATTKTSIANISRMEGNTTHLGIDQTTPAVSVNGIDPVENFVGRDEATMDATGFCDGTPQAGDDWLTAHDSDDDRWSGRRKFKPKSLQSPRAYKASTSSTAASSLLKKRKKSDSDDDEMDWDNGNNVTAKPASGLGVTRRNLIKTAESSDED